MEVAPPRWLDVCVSLLLPRDARECLLGDLHEESYIHVQDVRAAAYGYGGKTQEYRYQHPASQ